MAGTVKVDVSEDEMATRDAAQHTGVGNVGVGREFFAVFRQATGSAESGASVFFDDPVMTHEDASIVSENAAHQAVV